MRTTVTSILLAIAVGCSPFDASYEAKDYDPKLTAIAKTSAEIINAADSYLKDNGEYAHNYYVLKKYLPEGDLIPKPPEQTSFYKGWYYWSNGQEYKLSCVLGLDSALIYSSKNKSWTYGPGDGSPDKIIKLNVDS